MIGRVFPPHLLLLQMLLLLLAYSLSAYGFTRHHKKESVHHNILRVGADDDDSLETVTMMNEKEEGEKDRQEEALASDAEDGTGDAEEVEDDEDEEAEGEADGEEEDGERPLRRVKGCTNCARRRLAAERELSPEQIRILHIDEIKRQILLKLRLKEPPNVTLPHHRLLPAPLAHGDAGIVGFDGHQHSEVTRDVEDFYGQTEKIVVFPDNVADGYTCSKTHFHHTACLKFNLEADLPENKLASAELWVYKIGDKRDEHRNQTFSASDAHHKNGTVKKHSFVEVSIKSGWIKMDVLPIVRGWVHRRRHHFHSNHHKGDDEGLASFDELIVTCRTCSNNVVKSPVPISRAVNHRPFLTIAISSGSAPSRSKRSTNCAAGTTQCCRQKLYIDFKDIGWNDWIVQPAGYMANYCRGSCLEDAAISMATNHHTTIIQRLVQFKVSAAATLPADISPCCTPTRMSSISLVYVDKSNIYQKNLPNMAVDACGCS